MATEEIKLKVNSDISETTKDAKGLVSEFEVMGVSLNSVKNSFAKIIPTAKAMFGSIKAGLISTGIAWLLRFKILVKNGLIFQSQVSYLIPIFGTILSYIFLKELITFKVLISLIAVSVGIYFVRKADNKISKIKLD